VIPGTVETTGREARAVRPAVSDAAKLAIVLAQLLLLAGVIYVFDIEESRGFLPIGGLALVGFVVHALAPMRARIHVFLLLGCCATWILFGTIAAAWLLGIGGVLVALCHLPIPFPARVAMVTAVGLLLAALRGYWIPNTVPSVVWPVLGSMFMFRLIIYLYDLRHLRERVPWPKRLSYFFLLPNVCFPFFPVVDYKTYLRTHYQGDERENQQIGVRWIWNGVLHLIAYRLVYRYAVLPAAEVQNVGDAARYVVAAYLLYLRVSGQFHIVVGMLRLFGFHLPRTHHLYFLASSVNDVWRRMNIYWKDFMVKIVFNPVYMKIHRWNVAVAVVAATTTVFAVTAVLHAYQSFWLRGVWSFTARDALFWGLLGALVTAQSMVAMVRRAKGRPGVGRVERPGRSMASSIGRATAVVTTFFGMAILWSFWTAPSTEEWLSAFVLTSEEPLAGTLTILALLAGAVAVLTAAEALTRSAPHASSEPSFARSSALVASGALLLLGLALFPRGSMPEGALTRAIDSAVRLELSPADRDRVVQGYYEELFEVNQFSSPLWEMRMSQSMTRHARLMGVRPQDVGMRLPEIIASLPFDAETQTYQFSGGSELTLAGSSMRFNSLGFHDREYAREKPPGTYRIVVIGGSIALGVGVPTTQTFEAGLEEKLNASSGESARRFEVLNFGGLAAFPTQRRLILEKRALAFDPDAILYVAHGIDASGSVEHLASTVAAGVRVPYPELADLVEDAGAFPFMPAVIARKLLLPFADRLVEADYRGIVALCRDRGATPLWIYLPELQEAAGDGRRTALAELARNAGFVTVDLTGVYDNRSPAALQLTEEDFHPNPEGHRIIAERLYQELLKLGATTSLGLRDGPSFRFAGAVSPDALLGFRYTPGSTLRSYYEADPLGYYRRERVATEARWLLRTESGSEAALVPSAEGGASLRVAVRSSASIPWSVQLNEPGLAVEAGREYLLVFAARATPPRAVSVGVSQAHPPWETLGLYRTVELTHTRQEFTYEFAATATDDNARVHFDLGGTDADVELIDVGLRRAADDAWIEPPGAERFFVEYRFDSRGCRSEREAPSPEPVRKVLVLGDGYAMGVGLHAGDTVAARLERLFGDERRAGAWRRSEVTNCGVDGYGPREHRLRYEQSLGDYRANAVVLLLGADSQRLVAVEGKSVVDEIVGLARTVVGRDARFVVVLAAVDPSSGAKDREACASAAAEPLRDAGLTVLDLRETACDGESGPGAGSDGTVRDAVASSAAAAQAVFEALVGPAPDQDRSSEREPGARRS
jgi:hypothetical protein